MSRNNSDSMSRTESLMQVGPSLLRSDNANPPGLSERLTAEQFKMQMNYQSIKQEIDVESLVTKSLTILKQSRVIDATKTQSQLALSSLVKVIESKSLTAPEKVKDNLATHQIVHQLEVLDYFAAKDGLKYIGFLEQLHYNYTNKCKAELYDKTQQIRDDVEEARQQIQVISEYHYTENEHEMHDYDYPVIAEKILHHFPIDASRKLHEIGKFHNYGIKMALHWVYIMQRQIKALDPNAIEEFGIELLADIMVPSYALFVHFSEFIICMADAPQPLKDAYPLTDILGYLRSFYEALSVECSAIAESIGEIMVRIPGITREVAIEKMTKVYYAVNHCNYTSSKVLESLTPMLLYYQIKVILGDAGANGSHTNIDPTHDFKRFTSQRRQSGYGSKFRHSTGY